MRSIHVFAAAALVLMTLVGCSGPTHSDEDNEARGVIDADAINWSQLKPAVDEMLGEISRINAQGWPSQVPMTPDAPHRAQLRIHTIQNRTRSRLDVQLYKNMLLNALVKQGIVYVVGDAHDHAAVSGEREYTAKGGTTQDLQADEDTTGLVLQGEISDAVIDQADVKQHDFQFNLRLIETKKNRILAVSNTEFRRKKAR
jgi:hypothetical protein